MNANRSKHRMFWIDLKPKKLAYFHGFWKSWNKIQPYSSNVRPHREALFFVNVHLKVKNRVLIWMTWQKNRHCFALFFVCLSLGWNGVASRGIVYLGTSMKWWLKTTGIESGVCSTFRLIMSRIPVIQPFILWFVTRLKYAHGNWPLVLLWSIKIKICMWNEVFWQYRCIARLFRHLLHETIYPALIKCLKILTNV